MNSPFINIGIDLGSTISSIAMMDTLGAKCPGTKQPYAVQTVPSAVFVLRNKSVLVGQAARNALLTLPRSEGNGFMNFTRYVGSDVRFHFEAAGVFMSASELGAEIIRELLSMSLLEKGMSELPRSAVITIPPPFSQAQYEGTRRAAELAGLKYVVLPQEPVAAALAYGFTAKDQKARWVIFDLGGGTLDVSMVQMRGGRLRVPEGGHAGDAELGGANFDRDLLDYVLGPRMDNHDAWSRYRHLDGEYRPLRAQYDLEAFSNSTHEQEWMRLLCAVEEAKIRLSDEMETLVDLPGELCKDGAGKPVKVQLRVTRHAYEQLIHKYVDRAVICCRSLLSRQKLSAMDIDRLVLVGGPTRTPYLRTRLAADLGIQLDDSIDPMTAVSLGAAILSAHEDVPQMALDRRNIAGNVTVSLAFEGNSFAPECDLAGTVKGVQHPETCTIEATRADQLWSSGRQTVDVNGNFLLILLLVESNIPVRSDFNVTLRDSSGSLLATDQTVQIWHPHPATADSACLAMSIVIEADGNNAITMVRTGVRLPTQNEQEFATVFPIVRGDRETALQIKVIAVSTAPDGPSVLVGVVSLRGDDARVTSDIPKGTSFRIVVSLAKSRTITVMMTIPSHRIETTSIFNPNERLAAPRIDENVQFTVFRPQVAAPNKWYPILAFAHLSERRPDAPADEPDPVQEVQRQARQVLGEQTKEYRSVTQDSTDSIPFSQEITLLPEVAGILFDLPPEGLQFSLRVRACC